MYISVYPKVNKDNAISGCMGIPRVGVRQSPDPVGSQWLIGPAQNHKWYPAPCAMTLAGVRDTSLNRSVPVCASRYRFWSKDHLVLGRVWPLDRVILGDCACVGEGAMVLSWRNGKFLNFSSPNMLTDLPKQQRPVGYIYMYCFSNKTNLYFDLYLNLDLVLGVSTIL